MHFQGDALSMSGITSKSSVQGKVVFSVAGVRDCALVLLLLLLALPAKHASTLMLLAPAARKCALSAC